MIGQTISHYKILDRLGGGGMGVIYKAQDTRLDRVVALKFLSAHLQSDEHQKRFLHEARAASALDHPNICTIYEIGETTDKQLFIVMACYEGETLREKIEKSALSVEQTLEIAIQILQGLAKAHEHGIIHRDIKPANVVVTVDRLVKILDFGLAKLSSVPRITRSGTTLGTVAYMSPEQARGEDVDHRADLWSIGVLLFESLTGQLPFTGQNEPALLQAILSSDPQSIRHFRSDIPRGLESVIRKALSKTIAGRYSSAREMLKDLQSIRISTRPTRSVETPINFAYKSALPHRSGERRQVTVVVSHLMGFAELIEHLSPTEAENLLARIERTAHRVTENHGGIVNHFSGERIVTLFGVPSTNENDCIQAIRTTLELHAFVRTVSEEIEERTGEPVRLHSGVGTGHVVAEPLSEVEQYRVTGIPMQHATQLASRANSDEIWVSSECHRLLSPYFEIEKCDPIGIQGKKQPITPYRIVKESGLQSRLEAAEKIGLTPFAGRQDELNALKTAAQKAFAGEGQFVTIAGEAGIGKSRLLHEFRSQLEPDQFTIAVARCESHRTNIPYLPFIHALRALLDNEQDAGQTVRKIQSIDESLESLIPIYLYLLSIKHDQYPLPAHLQGEDLRLGIREALSAVFTLAASKKPLAMVLEDWHWADEESKEVLKQLAEVSAAYPMFLVVTYRPELPVQMGTVSNRTSLYLGPLDSRLSIRMIAAFLDVDVFPEELGRIIHDRTGGNPFFLEEVCYSLKEEGRIQIANRQAHFPGALEKFRLPESVEAVIRSRLDRLDMPEQEVLRLASVIGRDFSRTVLQQMMVTDQSPLSSLEKIKTFGLIQQISILPEAVYRFKHALTQHVVYESLLHHRRKMLHSLAGHAMEQLYQDRLDEILNMLAFHFSEAEEWDQAVQYATQAAQRAEKLGRYSEALELLEKANGWLQKVPDESARRVMIIDNLLYQERMGETLGEREKQRRIIEALLTQVKHAEDRKKQAEVYRRQGDFLTLMGKFDDAEEALKKAIQICKEDSNFAAERTTLRSMGFLRWHQGNNAEAVTVNEAVLVMDRQLGDQQSIAGDLINLGNALRHFGDLKRALQCLEEALEIYEVRPDPVKHASALHIIGNIYRDLDNNEKALQCLQRAAELSTKNRIFVQLPFHLMSIANIYLQQGKIDESLKLHQDALELNKRIKHADGLAQSHRIVAEILTRLENESEAMPHLLQAADLFAQLGDLTSEMQMRRNAATVQEHDKDYPAALINHNRVAELARDLSETEIELEVMESLARVNRLAGYEPDISLQYYKQAFDIAEKRGEMPKAAGILNSMAILEWSRGQYETALQHYESGLKIFEELEDVVHQGLMQNSIGATLLKLGRFEQAHAHLQRALACNRQTNEQLLEAHTWSILGEVWQKKNDTKEAIRCYESSLRLRRQLGDRRGEGWMLYHLAGLFKEMEMMEESEAYAAEARVTAQSCGDSKLQDAINKLEGSA